MLQKDNRYKTLKVFFQDPAPKGIGFQLREISRKTSIAPPSVKRYLVELEKEGLVIKKKHRIHSYPIYYANRDSEEFRFLKKINNIQEIRDSGLLDFLQDNLTPRSIILFGSASLGEDIADSDVDLFIQSKQKEVNLTPFEKKINRKINLLFSDDFQKLNKELKNNILNGVILSGYLKVF